MLGDSKRTEVKINCVLAVNENGDVFVVDYDKSAYPDINDAFEEIRVDIKITLPNNLPGLYEGVAVLTYYRYWTNYGYEYDMDYNVEETSGLYVIKK